MKKRPDYIGLVVEVTGASVQVQLDPTTLSGLTFMGGKPYRVGQVGSFIRIPVGYTDIYGIVTRIGAQPSPGTDRTDAEVSNRWITLELFGEGQRGKGFERGISQYPSIGEEAFLVLEEDLSLIYSSIDSSNAIQVGSLSGASGLPALVDINKFIVRHAAILGSTGSGKSTTIASLVNSIRLAPGIVSPRIILFDLHGEYTTCFDNDATVLRINTAEIKSEQDLVVPYWALTYEELLPLTFGDLGNTERSEVAERILALKRESLSRTARPGITEETLTVDSPVPFSIHRLWFELHKDLNATFTTTGLGQTETTMAYALDDQGQAINKGDALKVIPPIYLPQIPSSIYLSAKANQLNMRRQLITLERRLRDPRLSFLFRPGSYLPDWDGIIQSDLDALLAAWIGSAKGVVVLNLKGLPSAILSEIMSSVFRILFDSMLWSAGLSESCRNRPLWCILEEAHLYLGESSGSACETIRRVVKEGRKIGIGLTLVTQRPAEIDPTVLSQCGSIIALRLTNGSDQSVVSSAAPDNLAGLLKLLPSLRTGEGILLGEALPLPVRAFFTLPALKHRPASSDPSVISINEGTGWNHEATTGDYAKVIEAWRAQRLVSDVLTKPKENQDA